MPPLPNCTETFCIYQTLQNECIANNEEEKGCPASRQPVRTEGPICEAPGYVLTGICKNSVSGRHIWLERVGKNKDKPEQCILCNRLKEDIIRAENI